MGAVHYFPSVLVKRLAYIDWMRGLACLIMFQAHCYDSWLRPELQQGRFFRFSQLIATLPAPLFLFIAGVSVSLAANSMQGKGIAAKAIARHTMMRGMEVFGFGLLFRIQEYALGYRWVPWTDLLRVDILNMLGLSIAALGVLQWLLMTEEPAEWRRPVFLASLGCATFVACATPALWTNSRPRFLPWPIESYINGVHNLNEPQHWLFPFFPWAAFAFAGLAVGTALFSKWAQHNERRFFVALAFAGLSACLLSVGFDRSPFRLSPVYDYWHTSPNFFLMRCGVLLITLAFAFMWCRLPLINKVFNPTVQLGKTSLLVYWVHISFVYGTFSILPKHQCGFGRATLGLGVIFLSMLALSLWRTEWKQRTTAWRRAAQQAPAPAT